MNGPANFLAFLVGGLAFYALLVFCVAATGPHSPGERRERDAARAARRRKRP